MAVDLDLLLATLSLRGPAGEAEVAEAISAPPKLTRKISEATTLTVQVEDHQRRLLRSGLFDSRSWAVVDGLNFELVAVGKSADTITLTFEDAVVAALRRRTEPRSFPADTASRQQIARQLTEEARVPLLVDPEVREKVHAAVERSSDGQVSDSWAVLGSLAEDIGWRRFSDGEQIVMGSDAWLMGRLPAVTMREHTDGVGHIDFELDAGQPASRASLTLDTTRWSVPPGLPIDLPDLGPASGRWLVEAFERDLTRRSGSLSLVRAQPSLAEPPPEDTATAAEGDQGQVDFLPSSTPDANLVADGSKPPFITPPGYRDAAERQARANGLIPDVTRQTVGALRYPAAVSGPKAASTVPDKIVVWALQQKGKRYVWGASGPETFDCSGLVQEATRAAGKLLRKPAALQWSAGIKTGRRLSVEEGLRTRGALMFRIGGAGNHVAISLGNGSTMEARSTADGVGVFPNGSRQGYTGALLWQ